MDDETTQKIIENAKLGNIRFKKHTLVRSVERSIKIAEIITMKDDSIFERVVSNAEKELTI